MAKLVFGMPHRDVVRELKRRGCVLVRTGHSAREIWKTPNGVTISITARKDITPADSKRINQALGAEGIEEIRLGGDVIRRRPVSEVPKAAPPQEPVKEEPKKKEPILLRQILLRKLVRAKRRLKSTG